jgi:hypothetical protein
MGLHAIIGLAAAFVFSPDFDARDATDTLRRTRLLVADRLRKNRHTCSVTLESSQQHRPRWSAQR